MSCFRDLGHTIAFQVAASWSYRLIPRVGVACSHIRRDNLLLSSWPECMGGVALIVFKDDKAEIFAGIYVNGMRGSGACDVDAYVVFVRLHVVCINTFHCCIYSSGTFVVDIDRRSYTYYFSFDHRCGFWLSTIFNLHIVAGGWYQIASPLYCTVVIVWPSMFQLMLLGCSAVRSFRYCLDRVRSLWLPLCCNILHRSSWN